MKEFMGQEFLLKTRTASELYNVAKKEPIFDFSSRISAKDIAENKRFLNIYDAVVSGDILKYRALRGCGVEEYYITGDADDYEKFLKWAEVVPKLMGSPLYSIVHMELQKFFGIKTPLSPLTAKEIWSKGNEALESIGFDAINILKKFNVKTICTKNDPSENLEYHIEISQNSQCDTLVLPSFCPDNAFLIEEESFKKYIDKLSASADTTISSYSDLFFALVKRMDYFCSIGGRSAVHSISYNEYSLCHENEADFVFKKAYKGEKLSDIEVSKFQTKLFSDLIREYNKRNMVLFIYCSADENTNEMLCSHFGKSCGFYSIKEWDIGSYFRKLLNELFVNDCLPKTVIYSKNPKDIYILGSLISNFQIKKGRIQLGFDMDDLYGKNLDFHFSVLSDFGIFRDFIGVSVGSGSFLKYPSYEYFRRKLSDYIGNLVEDGSYPSYKELLKKTVSDICFNNIKEYLEI